MKLDKSQRKEQITSRAHRHGEPAENRAYPGCECRNEVRRSDLQALASSHSAERLSPS
jgi:hypothetical protein